ncbi:MAG: uroporphyrinogen-III C-methyltransferase, partial [Clostridiales bacterium]
GLLTVNACRELSKAEVVVYDRLISDSIMELIPPTAIKINVGKNVGHHPVPQEQINQILLEQALAGHYVVRLKGGDSFVFGRGGEELELLQQNGIEFRVIPGITSALAAATYSGIPVTHRDFCSSLHIITGHKKQDGALDIDYASLVKLNGTLVFLMSIANSGEILQGLLSQGMNENMPCAVIENGTRPNQRKFVSTLAQMSAVINTQQIVSPAIILVGQVCSLADKFDWFSALPLKGKKILVTRPRAGSPKMLQALRDLGAEATAIPAIKTAPLEFTLPALSPYSWLFFTSGPGVAAFFCGLTAAHLDARALAGQKIAAVGAETARRLAEHGLQADFVPSEYCGETMARELMTQNLIHPQQRLLLIRGKLASPALNQVLEQGAIPYDQLIVYDTVEEAAIPIDPNAYDLVTFTSASCVDAFIHHLPPNTDCSRITAVCIGRQTAAAAQAYGLHIHIAAQATIDAMIDKIKELCHAE